MTSLENEGWKLINVPGDGTCGYHAIMYSLENNEKLKNIAKTIKNIDATLVSNNKALGPKLRTYMSHKIDELLVVIENKNKTNNEKLKLFANYKLNNLLQSTPIQNAIEATSNNTKTIQNTKIISLLNQFKKELDNPLVWIEDHLLKFTAIVLKINIFVWNDNTGIKGWLKIIGNKENLQNSDYAIFLYYNGKDHYQSLLPKNGYEIKKQFENLPMKNNTSKDVIFQYIFLEKNSSAASSGSPTSANPTSNNTALLNILSCNNTVPPKIKDLKILLDKNDNNSAAQLKTIINQLFNCRSSQDIFLIKYIINYILKKKYISLKNILPWLRKNPDMKIDILSFIIKKYKNLHNDNV